MREVLGCATAERKKCPHDDRLGAESREFTHGGSYRGASANDIVDDCKSFPLRAMALCIRKPVGRLKEAVLRLGVNALGNVEPQAKLTCNGMRHKRSAEQRTAERRNVVSGNKISQSGQAGCQGKRVKKQSVKLEPCLSVET